MQRMNVTVNCPVCVYADEEIGGVEGMKIFVNSEEYRSLNCGFALDEGTACLSKNCVSGWTSVVLVLKIFH